jgi:hypothetical protein
VVYFIFALYYAWQHKTGTGEGGMHRLPGWLLVFLMLFCLRAQAQDLEPVSEPHAMIYYRLSFGSQVALESGSAFGFRIDRVDYVPREIIQYSELIRRPAALDVRFAARGVQSLKVSGVDYRQFMIARAAKTEAQGAKAEGEAAPAPAEGAEVEPAAPAEEPAEEEAAAPPAPEEEKLTITKVLEETPAGFLIGAAIGIALIAGVN